MKFGLVLEGGAMRGLFTAGVLDVLMENNISFDGAAGVSAGVAFGCNYKSNQHGRAIRYNTRFCNDKRYCSIQSLVKTGDMFGADFCYRRIPLELDAIDIEAYNSSEMEFFAVCTDVTTGKPVYYSCDRIDGNTLEWIRASASLPLVSRIVEIDGMKLMDGGISDSIPLKFMEERGYEKNIAVLTQPRNYRKQPSKLIGAVRIKMRKYPELVRAMENRHKMYNNQLKYIKSAEGRGRVFVIAPPEKLPIGHIEHNPDKMREVYRIGRKTANQNLDRIIEFMGKMP